MLETCWEYANGQKIYVYGKNLTPGDCLPLPWGYIHVYDHNIQTSTSLKPLCQLKPNFMWSIVSSPEPSGSQGELIVYPCSVVRPSVRRPSSVVHTFQRSSPLKPLGQSKQNFT